MAETGDSEKIVASRFWHLELDAVMLTLFMAVMAAWAAISIMYSWSDNGFPYGIFWIFLCGISGFGLFICAGDCKERASIISGFSLFCFVMAGAVGTPDEFSTMLRIFEKLHGSTFIKYPREKWEVIAIISTLYMAILYFGVIGEIASGFPAKKGWRSVERILALLSLSILSLVFALYFLDNTQLHFVFIIATSLMFAAIDWWVWKGLERPENDQNLLDHSRDARTLLVILDIPIAIALIILFLYYSKLNCPTGEVAGAQLECKEVYPFMAGAVAFQMISFNIIYVFFQARLHIGNGLQHVSKSAEAKVT